MHRRTVGLEPEATPRGVDNEERRDLADARFHGDEADELAVEIGDNVEDTELACRCLDIESRAVAGEVGLQSPRRRGSVAIQRVSCR